MRDNLSRRPPICNKRLYHDQSTNRDCHGSNRAVSGASDLLHHRSQVMRRTETATDLYRTVSSDSEHGATWAATYLGPLRTIAEFGPGANHFVTPGPPRECTGALGVCVTHSYSRHSNGPTVHTR